MKVGLIGYGYWGKNIARNFSNSTEFELHTICDLSEDNFLDLNLETLIPFIPDIFFIIGLSVATII